MSAARAEARSTQTFTNNTKGPPTKRKQQPDDDLPVLSTPSKAAKRAKRERDSSVNRSPKLPDPSRSHNREKAGNQLTSDSWSQSEQGQARVSIKKTGKGKAEIKNVHLESDVVAAPTSVEKIGRGKIKNEHLGSDVVAAPASVEKKSRGKVKNRHLESDVVATPACVEKTSRAKTEVGVIETTVTEIKGEAACPSKRKITPNKNPTETVQLPEDRQVDEEAPPKTPRRRKAKAEKEAEVARTEVRKEAANPSKKKAKAKVKDPETVDPGDEPQANAEAPKKTHRRRKTKEEKEAEAMPLAARTQGLRMFIGAHVSIATGVEKAVTNCVHIGGNAFALFLQSQRKWDNKPLLDENRLAFMSMCEEHKYNASDHVLPHGSYLVNLAQEEKDRAKQAYDHFLDDLKRCEALGIKLYNFHPGAAGKAQIPEAINRISAQLNRALAETHTAIPVLENMCGSGSVIGSRFSDLRDIIAGIKPEYKSRIGVCIDTCHAFAAGYDLRTPDAFQRTMQEFDEVIGLQYLKGLHINDSKAPFGSHRDLHQNIGLGFLGLRAFHNVMNEPRFHNMPLILETPCDRIDPSDPTGKKTIDDKSIWAREIKLLESLIGMDPEGDEFKKLEHELSEKGKASREKMQKAIDQKNEKAKKKREKGQRSLLDMMGKKKQESTDSSEEDDLDE